VLVAGCWQYYSAKALLRSKAIPETSRNSNDEYFILGGFGRTYPRRVRSGHKRLAPLSTPNTTPRSPSNVSITSHRSSKRAECFLKFPKLAKLTRGLHSPLHNPTRHQFISTCVGNSLPQGCQPTPAISPNSQTVPFL
jgi:hypothetical protein